MNTQIQEILAKIDRPKTAVVTAGMPYANGPLHIGHLAGAHVPADIYARWLGMLIGRENVLFVCGTDDHGSTSEVAAAKVGATMREFIDSIQLKQAQTLKRYSIDLDIYTGTSHPECFPEHKLLAQDFFTKIYNNKLLTKKTTPQWYDTTLSRFLPDRLVKGHCPNPKCENDQAYSDECDRCGMQYEPSQLQNPRSTLSDSIPIMKDTVHWWLDMWSVSEPLRVWLQSKKDKWRAPVYNEVINTVLPGLRFANTFEPKYKEIKDSLPKHKSKYALGKQVVAQFENKADLTTAQTILNSNGIETFLMDAWAHRSITRDVAWGIPLPQNLDPDMIGKTLYVWPDSLIAPISFSKVALKKKGKNPDESDRFWKEPGARIYQFLGQDNVFFYTLMQGALWLGSQKDPSHQPEKGDYQMTDIFGCFHLMVDGEKMSKSRGNFYTGDQLLDEKGFDSEQVRYFLALLSLPEKTSNFDMATLQERNRFLAGPLNAAFEKPISAVHSKFNGLVPQGKLNEKVATETTRMVGRYIKSMEKAEYATLLFALENYARLVNSMFTQFKPHDDRAPEESRRDALYSCFYVLKNLMIMLYPFVPKTMDKLRQSLNLSPSVFQLSELGTDIPAGHAIGEKQEYFRPVATAE